MMVQLIGLTAGVILLCAVLVLWRRELAVITRVLMVQGLALAGLVGLLAVEQSSLELAVVAIGVLVLRAGLLPYLLRRSLAAAGPTQRETRPLLNVAASLLAAAALTLLALAVSQPLTALAPGPATAAIPVGVAVVLIGFFVMVTRRRAVSQLIGFLLMDNGVTAVGFLTAAGVSPVVELGVSLDVLLAVLVLGILTGRMREAFGGTDLDELQELRD
ncbi:hydrogenase-4 component E [Pseudonocardia parietis]|uniref:Hydrogenase-4 component E n=2 Tax=Pseudonocardia parietis TaxID=570936 RepID=A0ABS4VLV2_9PSEU|nr:hydrogenase-4 component E [Pseudonocardia parietis]